MLGNPLALRSVLRPAALATAAACASCAAPNQWEVVARPVQTAQTVAPAAVVTVPSVAPEVAARAVRVDAPVARSPVALAPEVTRVQVIAPVVEIARPAPSRLERRRATQTGADVDPIARPSGRSVPASFVSPLPDVATSEVAAPAAGSGASLPVSSPVATAAAATTATPTSSAALVIGAVVLIGAAAAIVVLARRKKR
jgi:hypothetical protein